MRLRTPIAAAVVVLAGVACADAQDPTIGDSPPATAEALDATESPSATPEDTTGAETPTEAATEEAAERIEVTVSGGEVEGPGTVSLEAGTQVELVVTSDVADEIHVHGYDLHQDVAAGETEIVTFTADIPGVFEVELEERKIHLVELQVHG